MIIAERSTIADLAILRCKYGVVKITIDIDFMMLETVLVTLFTHDFRVIGRGETEAIALDDAFGRLQHRVGFAISEAVAARDAARQTDKLEPGEP